MATVEDIINEFESRLKLEENPTFAQRVKYAEFAHKLNGTTSDKLKEKMTPQEMEALIEALDVDESYDSMVTLSEDEVRAFRKEMDELGLPKI
jgi:hypothetical protein